MLRSLRAGENLHVVLWLIKDLCWVMDLRIAGMVMIFPTLAMAIWIAWRSRKDLGELLHCVAVVFWITANGTWMTGEFFFADGTRPLAIVFFVLGLLTVSVHYLILLPRERAATRSSAQR